MPLMFGRHILNRMNALQFILNELNNKKTINMFTDEYRSVLGSYSASKGLLLASQEFNGIYHLGGTKSISRYEFAIETARIFDLPKNLIIPKLQKEINLTIPRPKNLTLDSSKAYNTGFSPMNYIDELEQIKNCGIRNCEDDA